MNERFQVQLTCISYNIPIRAVAELCLQYAYPPSAFMERYVREQNDFQADAATLSYAPWVVEITELNAERHFSELLSLTDVMLMDFLKSDEGRAVFDDDISFYSVEALRSVFADMESNRKIILSQRIAQFAPAYRAPLLRVK